MKTDELDFELPAELIAQTPTEKRGESRLLHYQRDSRAIGHRMFKELPGLLRAGDLLVFNDARVIPARFVLLKETGGLVDGLFLSEEAPGRWRVMLRNAGTARKLVFDRAGEERLSRILEVVIASAQFGGKPRRSYNDFKYSTKSF